MLCAISTITFMHEYEIIKLRSNANFTDKVPCRLTLAFQSGQVTGTVNTL